MLVTEFREAATKFHTPDSHQRPSDYYLPPFQTFRDVLVGPSADRNTPSVLWPEFETQTQARLWRRNHLACSAPVIDASNPKVISEPATFVSMYDNHFGHMVAESVSRIPQSLAEAPDVPLYFTCDRPTAIKQTSGMFRSVLNWLNVPLEQIRFVHEPTLFRELNVAAQAEHLDGPRPPEQYLDLLEARISGNITPKRPEGITYVARHGLMPQKGRHSGESYLVACLRALGVQIVQPEKLSLPEQMRIYAESKYLVFAEGSAAHGRQLLGRIDQHISILRRRFRSNLALHQLTPRCTTLTYVACFGGSLHVTDPQGRHILHAMASLYNVEPVLEHFESLGVPLRKMWNPEIFVQLRDRDVLDWIGAIYGRRIEHWLKPHNTDDYMIEQLGSLGLGHLKQRALDLMEAYR